MTVKELKSILDKYPEDAIVYIFDYMELSAVVLGLTGLSCYKEKNEDGEKSVYLYGDAEYKKKRKDL